MKKTLLLTLTLCFAIISTTLFFTACGEQHHYGEWVITQKVTCEKDGQKYHVCTDEGCNHMEWELIPTLGHEFKHDPNHPNTNYNNHKTHHSTTCTRCSMIIYAGEEHSFDNSGICTICGYDKENDTYVTLN